MFDATLPSDPPGRITVAGRGELAWKMAGGETRLNHVHHTDPLRFLFPRREAGQPETAVLVTTSGGLVGGDRLDLTVVAGTGSAGLAMTQAAEKVYRSAGPVTEIRAEFTAEANAWLEWLPHETIVFDGARLDRRTRLNLAADARAIVGEILVFGRLASGERLTTGRVREAWEVRREGRLVWADAFDVDDSWTAVASAAAGLAGMHAMACIVCAAAAPEAARDAVRDVLPAHESADLMAAATIIAGLVIVRILARDPGRLRHAVADAWQALRTAESGFGPTLPRLWHM